jgi:riboflavin biosynthesis pyrimidine reductase
MDFDAFAARKTREAVEAPLFPLITELDRSSGFSRTPIGNDWTHRLYDGPFHQSADGVSLVFVQSKDGNTGADNPEDLGGGPIDKHLIYEGLSRVAADGVMAGAKSVGRTVFFSVWHPELVALRKSLALPRHPAQVLLTGSARADLDELLVCNVPTVPVFILTSPAGRHRLREAAAKRPWMTLVGGATLTEQLQVLREQHGLARISCIGGRTTATSLIDEGLVKDLYLTTTEVSAGEAGTPFYTGGRMPPMERAVRKRGSDPKFPIVFEHFVISRSS